MFIEFKDSFCFNDSHFEDQRGWEREEFACNELNYWIDAHPNFEVKIISYKPVYSDNFKLTQTHIFVEATKKK